MSSVGFTPSIILNYCWYTSIASGRDGIKQRAYTNPNIGRPTKIIPNDYGKPSNLLGPKSIIANDDKAKQTTNCNFLGTFLNIKGIRIADVK